MQTLGRFGVALIVAMAVSAVAAGLFLPIAGLLEGGDFNCFATDLQECARTFQLSMLLYGPWIVIGGAVVGTPLLMMLWAWRESSAYPDNPKG